MTRPNSITTNYSYDNLSRLLSVLHQSGSTTLDGASYTVDNAGNRTAKTDQYANVTSNYTYDPIYELTQVTQATNTTESYTYDAVGNRLSSLGVSSYTNNSSNELTSTSNATYTYDYNGNTQTKVVGSNTTSFAWDYENRLSSVTLPGSGGTVSFKYDPFGRRIYKSSSSGTSVFAYDGDNLIEETNSSGTAVARYAQTTNVDEPLAMLRGGATSFYQSDGLGSISSLTNASGAVAQTYTYDSFGKATASSGTLTNPFQFTAREFDAESGLYFLRNRYYDPQSGRFLNEDPLGFGGDDANFYAYVQNGPVDSVDPFGLQHKPGGPWHPDPWVKFACKWTDSCSALSTKIGIFKSLIAGHIAFDVATNQPGRHSDDIATFTNGLANCIAIHKAKCTNKQCPPEDTPVPVPVPAPQREPFRVPAPTPQAAANAIVGIGIVVIIIIAILGSPAGI
ncbi:MAG: RHS repeat-associated core domain-containing protein [Candidatus Acidiferrum sp.]